MNFKTIAFIGLIANLCSCITQPVPAINALSPSMTLPTRADPTGQASLPPQASATGQVSLLRPTVSPPLTPPSNSPQQPSSSPNTITTITIDPNAGKVSRLAFNQSFYRLFESGDDLQIEVQAFNSSGQQLPLSQLNLSWSSSVPTRIKVSELGLLTALSSTGDSVITLTEQNSGLSIQVNAEVMRSSGGGGGSNGGTTTHDASADVDYTDVEFEAE